MTTIVTITMKLLKKLYDHLCESEREITKKLQGIAQIWTILCKMRWFLSFSSEKLDGGDDINVDNYSCSHSLKLFLWCSWCCHPTTSFHSCMTFIASLLCYCYYSLLHHCYCYCCQGLLLRPVQWSCVVVACVATVKYNKH